MYSFVQDLQYGIRLLVRNPGVATAAVFALALGIGANTAIFTVVNGVLLRPLPFRDPDRLVALWEKDESRNRERSFVSPANFRDWSRQRQLFTRASAIEERTFNLTGGPSRGMEPEELQGERVSAGLFSMLGVQPVLGRTFRPEEGQPGYNDVVVLGYKLWQRRFGGDPHILGKTLRISNFDWRVIGVMPPRFHILNRDAQIWIPILLDPDAAGARVRRTLTVIARLRPGVTVGRARAEMAALGRRLAAAYPAEDGGWNITLLPLHEEVVGDVRPALMVLLAAVCALLLMACVNTANLLLARAVNRQREVGVRISLGAGRWRVARQLITESILLALAGGALGLAMAFGGVRLLTAFAPKSIPRLDQVSIDASLLLFTALVSCLTGVIFGLAPAVQLARSNLQEVLKEGGRGTTGGRLRGRLRALLVISETALAILLLAGAGLLIRSFARLRSVDMGLNPRNLLTMRVVITGSANYAESRRVAFFRDVVERVSALPGVLSAGTVSFLPLAGWGPGMFFSLEGHPPQPAGKPIALVREADPGYFRTMGIALLAGRTFTAHDDSTAPRVVVVNRSLARRFWGSEREAPGKRLLLDLRQTVAAEIVGVVGDVKAEGLSADTWFTIYFPHPQLPSPAMTLVVRTAGDPMRIAHSVARQVYALDPEQPVSEVRTMEQVVGESLAEARFQMVLLTAFAATALLLASVGIYGVMAYTVTERTHEIGVRMAVGASPGEVVRLVVRRGAVLAGIGIAVGLGAAFGLTRLMAKLLFGVPPADPVTFGAIAVLLGAVALAASWVPARRASRVAPMAALRHE